MNMELLNKLIDTIEQNYSQEELAMAEKLSEIATMISSQRIEMKLTQTQFAEILGVSQEMVSKWEKGNYNFTIRQLVKICDRLKLNMDITFSSEKDYIASNKDQLEIKIISSQPTQIVDRFQLKNIALAASRIDYSKEAIA